MGLFSKIFGTKGSYKTPQSLAEKVMQGTIDRAELDITFDVSAEAVEDRTNLSIEIYGNDEDLFTDKDGALLDAFQLFIKRAIQHHFPKEFVNVYVDCNGFREKANQSLVELAEKLKKKALEQGKSVYLRALPPKDRKVIHQFLAEDGRVKSRSVGDGLYKKIKIYPVKGESTPEVENNGQVH